MVNTDSRRAQGTELHIQISWEFMKLNIAVKSSVPIYLIDELPMGMYLNGKTKQYNTEYGVLNKRPHTTHHNPEHP